MKITGVLSLSNGAGLVYPYPVVLHSLQRLCDDVIIGVDPKFPLDKATVELFGLDNVTIIDAPWDLQNNNGGTEIALQMDKLVDTAHKRGSDWVIVMQADEMLHDDAFEMIRSFLYRNKGTAVNGFSTERIYFWKDLNTIRTDWNARLVRIFRPGTYSFLAEGTSKDGMYSGPVVKGEEIELPYKIYHYSRVDPDATLISKRVRNLDGFFHPEENLIPLDKLPEYDFVMRTHDNFSKEGFPLEVEGKLEKFKGTHPIGIKEWYSLNV